MKKKIAAIILAAGYSSRMGQFKPLLPLGDGTILERAIAVFRSGGIDDIRVVVGYRAADLSPVVERCRARPIFNDRYREGMFSSVVTAVKSLEQEIGAFFLLPVDIPLVGPTTVKTLIREFGQGKAQILYPGFRGKRGHPPVISMRYGQGIIGWGGTGGLRSFLAEHEADAANVEVADEFILRDIDTPEDYRRLMSMWRKSESSAAAGDEG